MNIDEIMNLIKSLGENVLNITIKCNYDISIKMLENTDFSSTGWQVDWTNTSIDVVDDNVIAAFERLGN